MSFVTIHDTEIGGEKLRVDSWYNGGAYAFHFGGDGSCQRTLFFQGDDATALRDEFDTLETMEPETLTRDLWLRVLDPHL